MELWWLTPSGEPIDGWFIVLKGTKNREVFVDTFHPINRKEARRLMRKALREQRLIRCQSGYPDLYSV